MQDIRLKVNFLRNPKTEELLDVMGSEGVLAVLRLWCYAGENYPDGALPLTCSRVAKVAGLEQAQVEVLVEMGWLEGESEAYQLHDWEDHQPWLVGSKHRSEVARAAIRSRWEKVRPVNAPNTTRIPTAYEQDTPSPSPSPSPSPKDNTRERSRLTLYRWEEFAGLYPAERMTPNTKAKAWWSRNVAPGDDELVERILANTRLWCASGQFIGGMAWNCGKYLTEGMVNRPPGGAGKKEVPANIRRALELIQGDDR